MGLLLFCLHGGASCHSLVLGLGPVSYLAWEIWSLLPLGLRPAHHFSSQAHLLLHVYVLLLSHTPTIRFLASLVFICMFAAEGLCQHNFMELS